MNKFPLTFAIIKPHVVSNPVALQKLQDIIADHKFEIIRSKQLKLTEPIVNEFYGEHKGKFFYNRLITFMRRCVLKFILKLLSYTKFTFLSVVKYRLSSYTNPMPLRRGETWWDRLKYSKHYTHIRKAYGVNLACRILVMHVMDPIPLNRWKKKLKSSFLNLAFMNGVDLSSVLMCNKIKCEFLDSMALTCKLLVNRENRFLPLLWLAQ